MTDWIVVAGDVAPSGGMDRANHGFVSYLASRPDTRVRVVAHHVGADLLSAPSVSWRKVMRPFGSHLIGAPLLARAGERAARLAGAGVRVLANGGNADTADATWLHYVHAAYTPSAAGLRQRIQAPMVHRYDAARERRALANARSIICNSRRTARDVQERHGVDAARIRVVYYGSDAEQFPLVSGHERLAARRDLGWDRVRPVALFIGALGDRRKGFDRLFEVWRQLCGDRGWDVNLAVAGTGSELPTWRRRARDAGIADRIAFLGFRRDVPRLIAASDVLVHPSRYEAYGLGVHEALCRGLPAIVSAQAGVAELYPVELAPLLIESVEDVHEAAHRLRQWRADPDAARQLVRPLSDRLRSRTWAQMACEMVRAMEAS